MVDESEMLNIEDEIQADEPVAPRGKGRGRGRPRRAANQQAMRLERLANAVMDLTRVLT